MGALERSPEKLLSMGFLEEVCLKNEDLRRISCRADR